jgi:hypothetical protein
MTVGADKEWLRDKVIVAVGTIVGSEKDERFKPTMEGWCKRREDWMKDMVGLKQLEEW